MSDWNHVELIRKGLSVWNLWREANPNVRPNLSGADLSFLKAPGELYSHDEAIALGYLTVEQAQSMDGCFGICLNLRGADLRRCDLSHSDLTMVDMHHADLTDADLSNAQMSSADLSKCQMARANLKGADLSSTQVRNTNSIGARLADCILQGSSLDGSVFQGSDFSGADCQHATFANADLSRCLMVEANLSYASFLSADLTGADLSRAICENASFKEANLSNAILEGIVEGNYVDLKGAIIDRKSGLWRAAQKHRIGIRCDIYITKARELHACGDHKGAERVLLDFYWEATHSDEATENDQIFACNQLGAFYRGQRNPGEALAWFERGMSVEENIRGNIGAGRILIDQHGRQGHAIELLRNAVRLSEEQVLRAQERKLGEGSNRIALGTHADALFNLGYGCGVVGAHSAAQSAFEEAISILTETRGDPALYVETLGCLAWVYLWLGDSSEALQTIESAVEVAEQYPQIGAPLYERICKDRIRIAAESGDGRDDDDW